MSLALVSKYEHHYLHSFTSLIYYHYLSHLVLFSFSVACYQVSARANFFHMCVHIDFAAIFYNKSSDSLMYSAASLLDDEKPCCPSPSLSG